MLDRIRCPHNETGFPSAQPIMQGIKVNGFFLHNETDLAQRLTGGGKIDHDRDTMIVGQREPGIAGRVGQHIDRQIARAKIGRAPSENSHSKRPSRQWLISITFRQGGLPWFFRTAEMCISL